MAETTEDQLLVDLPADSSMQEQLRGKVEKWLSDEGWSLSPQVSDGLAWSLKADYPEGQLVFFVGMPVGRPDKLILGSNVYITAEVNSRVMALAENLRNDLLWEIRFRLLEG